MSEHPPGSEWRPAGRHTICAIVDDRIYAVLYWTDGFRPAAEPGEHSEDLAGLLETHNEEAGWHIVFADDPDPQIRVSNPAIKPIGPDATPVETAAAMRSASQVAAGLIRNRLGISD
jgi:hypothetical protein